MSFTVLFFGTTADAVGSRAIEIEANERPTAGKLIDILSQKYPCLQNHKLLVSVNEQYAGLDAVLSSGDEVAVFTAVSGG